MRDRDATCVRKRDAARDKQEQPNRVRRAVRHKDAVCQRAGWCFETDGVAGWCVR